MKQEFNNPVALLVHACDRYELLYKGFEYFFNKYWKDPGGINYYFATEDIFTEVKGFKNIRSGKGQWSDRLRCLLESLPEDYVLYFQEDMWLSAPVNPAFVSRLVALARSNNWSLVKLHSADVYTTIPGPDNIEGFNISQLDNHASRYLMSHQVSLWRKDFLIAQLKTDEHPWRNERRGTQRLKKINPHIFHADYFAENGHMPINENGEMTGRSAYYSISRNASVLPSAKQFIDDMLSEGGSMEAYARKLQHNMVNGLTHDGLPRPKKQDIFKKIKNILRKM